MTETAPTHDKRNTSLPRYVLEMGITVSVLVAIGTVLKYVLMGGTNPARLLNFVSSALLGKSAYGENGLLLLLGLVLHIIVSCCWTVFFYLVLGGTVKVSKNWIAVGIIQGIVIWAGMVFIVMPISRIGFSAPGLSDAILDIVLLSVCAGIPLAHRLQKMSASQIVKQEEK